jgi:hypothetical protein
MPSDDDSFNSLESEDGLEEESRPSPWRYDLEENDFVLQIIGMAQPIDLWDIDVNERDLRRDNPHRAYVLDVRHRLLNLVDRFKSLNRIDVMLDREEFPLLTSSGKITRYEWSKVVLDVLLSRITSLRDCLFLLVSEIFELNLEPRDVNFRALKKGIKNRRVLDLLDRIASNARHLRDERDRHLHRGEERSLSGDMDILYKIMSMTEPHPPPRLGIVTPEGKNNGVDVNLIKMHQAVVAEIRNDFHREADALLALTCELLPVTHVEFESCWAAKRDVAKDVREWEWDEDE